MFFKFCFQLPHSKWHAGWQKTQLWGSGFQEWWVFLLHRSYNCKLTTPGFLSRFCFPYQINQLLGGVKIAQDMNIMLPKPVSLFLCWYWKSQNHQFIICDGKSFIHNISTSWIRSTIPCAIWAMDARKTCSWAYPWHITKVLIHLVAFFFLIF